MKDIKAFIRKITESEEFLKEEGEGAGSVGNTTANIDGYQTPNAFADEDDIEKRTKDNIDQYGYGMVDKKKKKKNFVSEKKSTYKDIMESLHEISYKSYKKDESRPMSRKINDSIKEIDQSLRVIERSVNHAAKLKTEMGVDNRNLWKSSKNRIVKIHDKLVRIGKKLNELGA